MNIGIYIYEHAEVLDFAGPFEVFSVAKRLHCADWNITLIAATEQQVPTKGNFQVVPHHTINDHPLLDLLVVPGGIHTYEMEKPEILQWLRQTDQTTKHTASVCTGVFLLANAGILNTQTVTTHWDDLNELQERFPTLDVVSDTRWVNQGKYTTSGGISAGIDMSLGLVERFTTKQQAEAVARQMEYVWEHK